MASQNVWERATGASAISTTVTPTSAPAVGYKAKQWMLVAVYLHLSAAGAAGNFTITRDAAAGSACDLVVLSQAMLALTDVAFVPEVPMPMDAGDALVCAYSNSGSKTYGLEVVWQRQEG